MTVRLLTVLFVLVSLTGCSKDPIQITTARIVDNLDRGSGNFDRMLEICFEKPLSSSYYHKIKVVTNQAYKLEGGSMLRPLASKPDAKCHYRNLYKYINKDTPVGARQMIKDYMVPGNINQLLVQIYYEEPQGNEIPVDEALFKNL